MQSPFAKLEGKQAPAPVGGMFDLPKLSGLLLTGKDVAPSRKSNQGIRSLIRGFFHVGLWLGAVIAQGIIVGNFGEADKDAANKTEGLYSKHFDFPKDGLNDLHLPLAWISIVCTLVAVITILVISGMWHNNTVNDYFPSQLALLVATLAAAFASAIQVYFLTMAATALKYDKDGSAPNAQDGDDNEYFVQSMVSAFFTLGALMTLYSYAATEFEHELFVPSLAWGFSLLLSRVLEGGYLEYDKHDPNGPGEPSGPTWEHIKAMCNWLMVLNTVYVLVVFLSKYVDPKTLMPSFQGPVSKASGTGPLLRSVFLICSVVTLTLSGILYNFAANEWTANSLGTSKWFSSGGRIITLVILALQFAMLQKQMDESIAKTKKEAGASTAEAAGPQEGA